MSSIPSSNQADLTGPPYEVSILSSTARMALCFISASRRHLLLFQYTIHTNREISSPSSAVNFAHLLADAIFHFKNLSSRGHAVRQKEGATRDGVLPLPLQHPSPPWQQPPLYFQFPPNHPNTTRNQHPEVSDSSPTAPSTRPH